MRDPKNILFNEEEKIQLEEKVKDLWLNYLFNYMGEPLTEDWVNKKYNNDFWIGLGDDGHAFLDFKIEYLPKYYDGEKVFQIDYFKNDNFDFERFIYAANGWRYFLPNDEELNYDSFYIFLIKLSEQAVYELQWI